MSFDTALNIATGIFVVGILYKLCAWFFKNIGWSDRTVPVSGRIFSGIEGVLLPLFSIKIFSFIKVFFVDVLLQFRILADRKDPFAWIMHILIFIGFIALLLLHTFNLPALFSSNFYSTTNPSLFLRNFFGLLVLAGLVLAVLRRKVWMKDRIQTSSMDIYAIAVLAVIIISGFLLEGMKITSHSDYQRMVDEYSTISDDDEVRALEAYWVKNFSVVSPNIQEPIESSLLSQGEKLHEMSCMECHDQPQAAFISYGLAGVLKPFSLGLDRSGLRTAMWYIHFLACLAAFACLPFSKLNHIFSTPVSIFVAELSQQKQGSADIATRQVIELDGCSHGGTCHIACPVRKRRQERIAEGTRFAPSFDYIEKKSCQDLGSREVVR